MTFEQAMQGGKAQFVDGFYFNRLSFTKSPFLNYSFKYSVLSAEVASKIEMVIFRKKLLHHPFSCARVPW